MRTKAIILKKQPTNEHDQLVTCYTEEFGKVQAVAKSALKPGSIQGMHLDAFNLVDFELISGRGMPIITGAQVDKTYLNLKEDLKLLSIAYFFSEVSDRLFFEYQKDEEMWSFLMSTLSELNSSPGDPKEFFKKSQLKFLDILGYAPNFRECAFCNSSISGRLAAYSTEVRGGICRECFFSGVRGIVVKSDDFLSISFLGSIFEGLAEKKLNSLNFLNSVLR